MPNMREQEALRPSRFRGVAATSFDERTLAFSEKLAEMGDILDEDEELDEPVSDTQYDAVKAYFAAMIRRKSDRQGQ